MGKGKDKETGKGSAKKEKTPEPMITFFSMFRYATTLDKTLMILGSLAAIANGASMYHFLWIKYLFLILILILILTILLLRAVQPAFAIIVGRMTDLFSPDKFSDPNYKLATAIIPVSLWFLCIFSPYGEFRQRIEIEQTLQLEHLYYPIWRPDFGCYAERDRFAE